LKIAQVCPRYYPDIGGIETHVKEISERLVNQGFEIDVLCTGPADRNKKSEIINGVKVIRFGSFAPYEAYYFSPRIYLHLKNHRYDLIHAHSYHAMPALFAALAKNGHTFVFTPHYHGRGHTFLRNLLHKPYKPFGNKIFEKADKVICVSEYERQMVISDFNIPPWKIEKIPNGINLEDFRYMKHLEKNEGEKTILYVGRLEKYKGIHHIIGILLHLRDFKLNIIGQGPYEKKLLRLAEELAVSDRINWHKNVTREKILQFYASADVFMMLSTNEAYGITVAEALASGTPCIVATGSALDEFVDGEMCLGVNLPVRPEELLEKINKIMLTKRVKYLKNLMTWDKVVELLVETYKISREKEQIGRQM